VHGANAEPSSEQDGDEPLNANVAEVEPDGSDGF